MNGALQGVRVLEFASYVAGPFAGAMLADLGADVIKVETPPRGDPYRGWEDGNYSRMFCSLNRAKRSIMLDLKSEAGMTAARRLIADADVVVENMRPGVLDRLGLGYGEVSSENPRLVYCSISGFGLDGPYSDRPGYDTIGQATSGLLSLLTDVADPKGVGTSISDHLAGLYAAYGILGALHARERTGQGQRVDTSLLQASTAFIAENMARYLRDLGTPPDRATRVRTAQVYAIKDRDGRPFVIHLSSPEKFWRGVLRAIDRLDLSDDPRFETRAKRIANREAIEELFRTTFVTDSREGWLEKLRAQDVPCAPLNSLADVVADPQIRHLGLVREVTHPQMGSMNLLGSGVNLHGTPATTGPAPVAGEHTDEILVELGLASVSSARGEGSA